MKSVGVFRPKKDKFVSSLEGLGFSVLFAPCLKVVPVEHAYNPPYDWIVFTSVNGVENYKADFKGEKIACIGPATAKAVEDRGGVVTYIPDEFIAESVNLGDLRGQKVLLPRAKKARDVLPESLKKAGAIVDVVVTYDVETNYDSLAQLKEAKKPDFLTFTSGSTVDSTIELLERAGKSDWLRESCLVCIGPITEGRLRENGLPGALVAREYTTEGIVEVISEVSRSL